MLLPLTRDNEIKVYSANNTTKIGTGVDFVLSLKFYAERKGSHKSIREGSS
jgi:hypothetical protein